MKSFFSALSERRQLNWRRILLLKSHYSVNVFNTKKIAKLGQNITNVGFHDKPLICFRPKRRLEGPAWAPGGFNFFFCLPWIPPRFQFFLPPFLWIPAKVQTMINEIQVTKIKKYERFIMKSDIGDILAQFGSLFAIEYVYVIMWI